MIIETDIGHDPDDYFAICYLVSAGVKISCILVCPGDPDQIAIAKFLCKQLELDIPIAASKLDRTKLSSGSVHHELLKKYNQSLTAKPDGLGIDILSDINDDEAFVIGPVASLGAFLKTKPNYLQKATMQGGFLGYHLHDYPVDRLPQFNGKTWMPTFNLNGDRTGAANFLNAKMDRRFVGKNVCHTVLYDKSHYEMMQPPQNRAAELFMEGMGMYLEKHDFKKFHDPTAAVCHLYPDIGYWVKGKVTKMDGGWGTVLDESGDDVLAHIDYEKLWDKIYRLE